MFDGTKSKIIINSCFYTLHGSSQNKNAFDETEKQKFTTQQVIIKIQCK